MSIRLSAAVMTHPSRLADAERLRDRHPELGLRIVVDPEPDGPPSALRAARRAWATVPADATHHLVLQDDVLLCEGFLPRLRALIAAQPGHALCLFAEWASRSSYAVRLAALLGHDRADVIDLYTPTVALVLSAAAARDFSSVWVPTTAQDDVEIHAYLAREGIPARVAVPNLVEHLPGPSLTGNDYMGTRRSAWFACPGAEGSHHRPPPRLPTVVPYFSWMTSEPRCVIRSPGAPGGRDIPLTGFLADRRILGQTVKSAAESGVIPLLDRYAELPPGPLMGLWLTAFTLGMCWQHEAGVEITAAHSAPDQPGIRGCLETMVDGGLRWYVTAGLLRSARSAIAEMVISAIRTGLLTRTTCTPRLALGG